MMWVSGQERVLNWAPTLFEEGYLFKAIESNGAVLMSPVELVPRPLSDMEVQLAFYRAAPLMRARTGPLYTHTVRFFTTINNLGYPRQSQEHCHYISG